MFYLMRVSLPEGVCGRGVLLFFPLFSEERVVFTGKRKIAALSSYLFFFFFLPPFNYQTGSPSSVFFFHLFDHHTSFYFARSVCLCVCWFDIAVGMHLRLEKRPHL